MTPKSHDSETRPPAHVDDDTSKVSNKNSHAKPTTEKASKKKESSAKLTTPNNEKELEMEEEPKVDQMKQDFHFYAMDHYNEAKQQGGWKRFMSEEEVASRHGAMINGAKEESKA